VQNGVAKLPAPQSALISAMPPKSLTEAQLCELLPSGMRIWQMESDARWLRGQILAAGQVAEFKGVCGAGAAVESPPALLSFSVEPAGRTPPHPGARAEGDRSRPRL
jgi:hypothetical protein